MSILYRAIWNDRGPELVSRVQTAFSEWVKHKSFEQLSGTASEATPDGAMRVCVEHADGAGIPVGAVLRAAFVETSREGSRWTTSVRSWEEVSAEGEFGGWVWLDVEAVADDLLENVTIAAPKFVAPLLLGGCDPHRHGVSLTPEPTVFSGEQGAEELAELVTDIERDVPLVVFSALPSGFQVRDLPQGVSVAGRFDDAIARAATMTAGLALVCRLDEEGTRYFNEIVGSTYEVRDGAFRIYLPGVDPAVDEGWRHRYTVPARFLRYRDAAGRLVGRAIALRAGARRPPDSYDAAVERLDSARSDEPKELHEYLDLAEAEIVEHRLCLAVLDQKYLSVIEEQQQLEADNNRLRADLELAWKKLRLVGRELWEDQADSVTELESRRLPDNADSPGEAALYAQEYLIDFLSFPDDACKDLDDIDTAVEARAWGETSWRGFRALHAYGQALAGAEDPGSFWTWCENSRHSYAWPASSKKLAMVESDSVKRSDRLRAKRVFPVDRAVDPSGSIYMEAHLKIAEGGGVLAPRIYFLPSRETGKVYIGYFGPHKNVPNTLA
ncbi:hypothetical protein [Amycolatopsis alba]|uniref:hypothetical protein n=1 Tax=Amycolatopsis alba TaxID=76020 RepID=UPI0003A8CB9A|nr:hypothetical protein [Amycolatopsis alba]